MDPIQDIERGRGDGSGRPSIRAGAELVGSVDFEIEGQPVQRGGQLQVSTVHYEN
jgi:hypothetical protein